MKKHEMAKKMPHTNSDIPKGFKSNSDYAINFTKKMLEHRAKVMSKVTNTDKAFSRHGEHLTDQEHENSLNKYFDQRKRRKS